MDILLFGRQGSGKGTQAQKLVEKFGFKIFGMSNELKKVIQSGSQLGQEIKNTIDRGDLVGDELIMQIVAEAVAKMQPDEKIIFDGIPRTIAQKDAFEKIMQENKREATGLLIDISNAEAEERITIRRICSKCHTPADPSYPGTTCEHCGGELIRRTDDNADALRKRLALYESETMPVVNWYAEQNRLIKIDGMPPIPEVAEAIATQIQNV